MSSPPILYPFIAVVVAVLAGEALLLPVWAIFAIAMVGSAGLEITDPLRLGSAEPSQV